jgi:hypothetical protein
MINVFNPADELIFPRARELIKLSTTVCDELWSTFVTVAFNGSIPVAEESISLSRDISQKLAILDKWLLRSGDTRRLSATENWGAVG